MNQPFLQIGTALVNTNAIASVTKNRDGTLFIRFIGNQHFITIKADSAAAVSKALMPFVNAQVSGAPEAALAD